MWLLDGVEVEVPPTGLRRVRITAQQDGTIVARVRTRGGRHPQIPDPVRDRIEGMREQGMTMREIARLLTQEGVPTSRGGPWSSSTVQYVLAQRSAR
jgi:hypothetical protein